jgi:hypothetical protein
MHKTPYVFPIVGGRTVEHLKQNIEALTIHLSEEDITEIDNAVPFDIGFPNNLLWGGKTPANPAEVWLVNMGGVFDYVPLPKVCWRPEKQPVTTIWCLWLTDVTANYAL